MSKLPNADLALVPRPKITDYLLSGDHPDGARKAAFLKRFGFEQGVLEIALLGHAP